MSSTGHSGSLLLSSTVSGELREGVLVITINNPPVNAISEDVRAGLDQALTHSENSESVIGLVITGAGKTFIGGADIREFGKPVTEPSLPSLLDRIEGLAKPVVAGINGAALGGGLEVALACHYRLVLADAQLGLPEVKLGVIPGAGGTQRLPRLAGVPAALDLIGSGRTFKAKEALSLGIVDEIAQGKIEDAAMHAALRLSGKPLRRTGEISVAPFDVAEAETIVTKVFGKSRGQKAPMEALRLVRAAGERSFKDGLANERLTFLSLRDSSEATALRHVFFAERAASKVDGLDSVEPRDVRTIGVVGLGLMGSGIAAAALGAGYRVIGLEQTIEASDRGRERIFGLLDRSVASGRVDVAALTVHKEQLVTSADDADLAGCDLIIEAVFDDLAVKTELFQRLDRVVRPQAVLATNTSYLNPDEIAAATAYPERVIGLHFFSPAHVMRLVEVVRCGMSAPDALATGLAVAKRLRKLPVVTGVCDGFIGNRIFSAYRREAEFLIEDGAMPHEVDAALEDYGFPMGLFAVNDMAGLEIAWARRKRQAVTRDASERYVDIADRLCEAGRFGQKSGLGWYAYSDGKRTIDPNVTLLIEAARAAKGIVPRPFTRDDILTRLMSAMVAEGQALLTEGIATRSSDIDLVMINGYGFPAHKGGPMFAAGQSRQPEPLEDEEPGRRKHTEDP
jgi:3-hydroxyacyl-CoA dehydrogenase